MFEIFYWWWLIAISNLLVLAYMKKEESNIVMYGVTTALLFTYFSGFALILTVVIIWAITFIYTKIWSHEKAEQRSLFWLLCGLGIQSHEIFMLALGAYVTLLTGLKLASKWVTTDKHTLQACSAILGAALYVFLYVYLGV